MVKVTKITIIFIIILNFINVSSSSTEYNALSDLYYSTNGHNWINKWNITLPNYCEYYGILCTNNNNNYYVESINLESNNLVGSILPSINNLQMLTFLTINNNDLGGDLSIINAPYIYANNNHFSGNLGHAQSSSNTNYYIANNNYTGVVNAYNLISGTVNLSNNYISSFGCNSVYSNVFLSSNLLENVNCVSAQNSYVTNNFGKFMNISLGSTYSTSNYIYDSNIYNLTIGQSKLINSNVVSVTSSLIYFVNSSIKNTTVTKFKYPNSQVLTNYIDSSTLNYIEFNPFTTYNSFIDNINIQNSSINTIVFGICQTSYIFNSNITIYDSKINNVTIPQYNNRFNNTILQNIITPNNSFYIFCQHTINMITIKNNLTFAASNLIICNNNYLDISYNNIYGELPPMTSTFIQKIE
jgi:hypothetical protein